jgi:hypothetical protein
MKLILRSKSVENKNILDDLVRTIIRNKQINTWARLVLNYLNALIRHDSPLCLKLKKLATRKC